MEIKIVRYNDSKHFYAKIRVSDCENFIAFQLDKNNVIDNGYGLYVGGNPPELRSLLSYNQKDDKNENNIYTNEITLMDDSITELENLINSVILNIKANYSNYRRKLEFEKKCIEKWQSKEVERIVFSV